jgi:hypothetical protein
MRINVYAEELTTECIFITKVVDNRTFYGIRLFLQSSPELHYTLPRQFGREIGLIDGRSAITFWVPWRAGENHHYQLLETLEALVSTAHKARLHEIQSQIKSGQ